MSEFFVADVQDARDFGWAKEIGEILHSYYPGHKWAVACRGGVVHIKNMRLDPRFGMVLHWDGLTDANERKHKTIMAGGEYLERAGWKRGAYEGQAAGKVEGIPHG